MSEGDEILVKCIDIDPSGRIRLSRKEALAEALASARVNPRLRVARVAGAEDLPLPSYATEGAAGLDLRAAVARELVVAPGERVLVPTGLRVAVPRGYEAQVRPRSGLALRHGILLPNCTRYDRLGLSGGGPGDPLERRAGALRDRARGSHRAARDRSRSARPARRGRARRAPPRGAGGFGSTGEA